MGFYFRKSVNLSGLRFNFSKSGIGVSTGVKGFRIGSGPRGNYVQIGKNGIYYKKTWGNSKRNTDENTKIQNIKKNNGNYTLKSEYEDLDEYNTEEICDSSSAEFIEEMRNNYRKITLKWFSLLFLFDTYLFILTFILFAFLDYKRKTTIIFYDIDEEAESRLQQFYNSFDEIAKCQGKWYILSENYNFDAKYNSGASSLVNRINILITNKVPKYVKTNVKIPCISAGKQKLYFFPDRILIIEGKKVGALSYKNLKVSVENGNFVETEMKPWDGTVVDYTYKYVNKSGGPDRRFADNPRCPIMSYSYINFYGDNGFKECIMLSRQGVGNLLKEQINILQSQEILEKENNIDQNKIDKSSDISEDKTDKLKDINENKIDNLSDINEVINNTEKLKNEEINTEVNVEEKKRSDYRNKRQKEKYVL